MSKSIALIPLFAVVPVLVTLGGCSHTDDLGEPAATSDLVQTKVVRNTGGPFAVLDGTLFRMDENGDLFYGPADDAKGPDKLLAHLSIDIYEHADLQAYEAFVDLRATKDFVVVSYLDSSTSSRVYRVARATGAVETLPAFKPKTMTPMPMFHVGDDATVYVTDDVIDPSGIWKLSPGAPAFERVDSFSSPAFKGKKPRNIEGIFPSGGDIFIRDERLGIGRIDTISGQYETLGTTGTPFGLFNEPLELIADSDNVYAVVVPPELQGNHWPSCGKNWPNQKLFAMPRSVAGGTNSTFRFEVSAYWWDVQVDAKNFYVQDYCTGDVIALDKSTGAVTTLATRSKTDPVNRDLPGAGDRFEHQYKTHASVDGPYVYFLDDATIKRVAKP